MTAIYFLVIPPISFVEAKPIVVGGTPTVRWRISGSRYSQTSSGSLVITDVRGSDQRAYECQAVNAAGTASRNVNLRLIFKSDSNLLV